MPTNLRDYTIEKTKDLANRFAELYDERDMDRFIRKGAAIIHEAYILGM